MLIVTRPARTVRLSAVIANTARKTYVFAKLAGFKVWYVGCIDAPIRGFIKIGQVEGSINRAAPAILDVLDVLVRASSIHE